MRVASDRLRVTIHKAINLDSRHPKPRLQYHAEDETVRAHSSNCGLTAEQLLAEEDKTRSSLAGIAADYGSTLGRLSRPSRITSIVATGTTGLQPEGEAEGAKYRLCHHVVLQDPPTQWDCGSVLLTGPVPLNLIHSIHAVEMGGGRFTVEVARGSPDHADTELELEEEEADRACRPAADEGGTDTPQQGLTLDGHICRDADDHLWRFRKQGFTTVPTVEEGAVQ